MKSKYSLLMALLVAVPIHAMDSAQRRRAASSSNLSTFSKYGLGAAALAGLAYLGNRWWQGESSEKMKDRAEKLYSDLETKRKKFRHIQLIALQSIAESDLEKVATPSNISILRQAQQDKKALDAMRAVLAKRISRDSKKKLPIVDSLRSLANKIEELSERYEQMAAFWQEHANYLGVKQAVDQLEHYYARIRKQPSSEKELRKTVVATGVKFPFASYAERLRYDLKSLARIAQQTEMYSRLQKTAQSLLDDLQEVLATLTSLYEYSSDVRMKQEYEIEQRRLAMERQRLQDEQHRIFAERLTTAFHEIARAIEQNRIREQQAKNSEEKARLERERKELEKKQADLKQQQEAERKRQQEQERQQSSNYPGLYPSYNQQTGTFVNPPAAGSAAQSSGTYDWGGMNIYDQGFSPNPAPSAPPANE